MVRAEVWTGEQQNVTLPSTPFEYRKNEPAQITSSFSLKKYVQTPQRFLRLAKPYFDLYEHGFSVDCGARHGSDVRANQAFAAFSHSMQHAQLEGVRVAAKPTQTINRRDMHG